MTVGELVVLLRANTAAFSKDLDKAQQLSFNSSKEIERSFRIMSIGITAAVTALGAVFAHMIDKTVELGDKIGKMSEKTGVGVKAFQELSYAAKISDIDMESFSISLARLDKNIFAAQTSNTKLAETFRVLGVNVATMRTTDQVLLKLSDTFSRMPDGVQKTGAAMAIFGRAGADMIPFLNQGPARIHELMEEANKLGIVLSGSNIAKLSEVQDNMKRLDAAIQGLKNQLVIALLPALQDLSKQIIELAKGDDIKVFAEGGIFALQVLASTLVVAATEAANLKVAFASSLSFSEGEAKLKENYERGQKLLDTIGLFKKSGMGDLFGPLNKAFAAESGKGGGTPTGDQLNFNSEKMDQDAKAIARIVEELKQETETFGLDAEAVKRWKLEQLGATSSVLKGYDELTEKLRAYRLLAAEKEERGGIGPIDLQFAQKSFIDQIDAMMTMPELDTVFGEIAQRNKDILANTTVELQRYNDSQKEVARQIQADSIPAIDRYNIEQARMNTLVKDFGLAQEAANIHMEEYKNQLGLMAEKMRTLRDIRNEVGNSLATLFDAALFHAKDFKSALAGVLEQMAMMIIQIGVIRPLLDSMFGPPAASGAGGFLGSILSGLFKASGGPVLAGESYMVGENGPERFVPAMSGMIVPNSGKSGGDVYIDARGADPTVEYRLQRMLAETENRAVMRALNAQHELAARSV